MAIDYSNTAQYMGWGALSSVQNLTNRTIMSWVYKDTNVNGTLANLIGTASTDEQWSINQDAASGGKFNLLVRWSVSPGQWILDTATSTGAWHLMVFTYNNSSATNDPLGYLDGASVTITEAITPSGTYRSGTDNNQIVGSHIASIDGRVASFLIYNRILSASEIADAYASRLAIPTYRGLVFAPMLWGVAGGADNGDTLGSSNKIVDLVSGSLGTPAGSPVFRDDNYLIME